MLKCLLCGAMIEKRLSLKQLLLPGRIPQPKICIKCQSRLVLRKSTHPCPGCGRKLLVSETICWECQQWQHQYGWLLANQSLYAYNDMMREYMKRYKFQGDYGLRLAFQAEFNQFLKEFDYDVLVPIPIAPHTWQTRGFNQTTALLTLPYTTALTTIANNKQKQSSKTRQERLKTPQIFRLTQPQKIIHQRVLLVDDVYTTGRTLYHAAVLCHQAGCLEVKSATLVS